MLTNLIGGSISRNNFPLVQDGNASALPAGQRFHAIQPTLDAAAIDNLEVWIGHGKRYTGGYFVSRNAHIQPCSTGWNNAAFCDGSVRAVTAVANQYPAPLLDEVFLDPYQQKTKW